MPAPRRRWRAAAAGLAIAVTTLTTACGGDVVDDDVQQDVEQGVDDAEQEVEEGADQLEDEVDGDDG